MILQRIWYFSVKFFLKIALHFYCNKISISGKKNIPKKDAILFAVNHPNALLDPLFIAAFNPRINHFLVRADVFKKPIIKKALATLNLMPIYRIRDGRNQLNQNDEIFEKCYQIFEKKETLLIFPQGGHSRDRNVKPLSKGFTRIVFGALDKNPEEKLWVVPVGITYQNSSSYPCKVAVKYGQKIDANSIYGNNNPNDATTILKDKVSNQLKKLTVHIPDDENYANTLQTLNEANVDFTKVKKINSFIQNNSFPKKKNKKIDVLKPLRYLIILNSIIPYLLWKNQHKKIKELEFVDTFRFGLNVFLFPIFYAIQAWILSFFTNSTIGLYYFLISILLVFIYTKSTVVNTEE